MRRRADATSFRMLFGREPEWHATAHGRVNLIGEHTEYNSGFVLPSICPQSSRVELSVRDDRKERAWSASASRGAQPLEYELGHERCGRGWLDYVQGATSVLLAEGLALRGFELAIRSDVPVGAGLSSSGALEIALLRGLRTALELPLDDIAMAKVAQRVESEFLEVGTGIMDQMAIAFGAEGVALFVDTRSLNTQPIAIPAQLELVVVHSGFMSEQVHSDLKIRRAECEAAAQALGVATLRDVGVEQLGRIGRLPEPLARRARHIVTENARVLGAVSALRRGDLMRLGELFAASHRSLRDDYEVSIPQIDTLVELASDDEAIVGARLTGSGFGGAVVMLARAGAGIAAATRIARAYEVQVGRAPHLVVPAPVEPPLTPTALRGTHA